jgi:hypothetical protein
MRVAFPHPPRCGDCRRLEENYAGLNKGLNSAISYGRHTILRIAVLVRRPWPWV